MITDADGREWVLVPKEGDWNMTKAALGGVVVNTTSVVWAHQGLVAAAVHETLLGRRREP